MLAAVLPPSGRSQWASGAPLYAGKKGAYFPTPKLYPSTAQAALVPLLTLICLYPSTLGVTGSPWYTLCVSLSPIGVYRV